MVDVVIDTDVASFLQKDRAPEWVHEAIRGARIWLTFVTVGELSKWAVVRRWGDTRRDRLDLWVARRPVIPYDREIAGRWGELAGTAQLRGRPRPQNDTWIAACCVRHEVPLVTLNSADFKDFADNNGLILLSAT